MPWAKLDDRFHSHPKVREAWYRCPASIGLHVMCITYAADHETDGVVPSWFVAAFFQRPKDLQAAVSTLTELGMWVSEGEDFRIHDFLNYHPSKKEAKAQRELDQRRRIPGWMRVEVAKRDGRICRICQQELADGEVPDFDHIFPVSRGGETCVSNLQIAHAECNRSKGARILGEI